MDVCESRSSFLRQVIHGTTIFHLPEQSSDGEYELLDEDKNIYNSGYSIIDAWILILCAPIVLGFLIYGYLFLRFRDVRYYRIVFNYVWDYASDRLPSDEEYNLVDEASEGYA